MLYFQAYINQTKQSWITRNMGDKTKNKENKDPDYVFFDREKSHNSSFYNKTPGVCTSTKMELEKILRTTEFPTSNLSYSNKSVSASTPKLTSDSYWQDPFFLLREEGEKGNVGGGIAADSWRGVEENQRYRGKSSGERTGNRGGISEMNAGPNRWEGYTDNSGIEDTGRRDSDGDRRSNVVENMGSAEEDNTGHRDGDREVNIVELMDADDNTSLAAARVGNADFIEGCSKRKRKGKGGNNRGNKKKPGNLSRYSQREIDREIERNSKKSNEKIQIDSLKQILGDPWDAVCFDDKKQFALHFYYTNLQVNNCWCCVDFDLIGGGGRRFLTIIFQ